MSQTYVYIRSEPGLWTVGFHRPDGGFESESDHGSTDDAAKRVAFLNGGGRDDDALTALNKRITKLEQESRTVRGLVARLADDK